ncbi:hypothetical protein R1sor_015180 [Riccia sorocarpa]|uniref:Apple domain-containing protein n=1 Tax=Riccia sorocarpa TaxID=122646 RepID=A0ABD3HFT2_9MARC
MTGEEKVYRSSVSLSGRSRLGSGVAGNVAAGMYLNSGYVAHNGERKRRCSYKRATALVCAINVLAAIYMLHGVFGPRYGQIPRSVPLTRLPFRNGTLVLKYTKDEIERIKQAHDARKAAEPVDLMRRVKEIEEESLREAVKDKETEETKQKVAAELAERLRELRGNQNQHQSEALDEWRRKKIEEAKKRGLEARLKDVESSGADAKSEVVKEADYEDVVAASVQTSSVTKGGKLLLKGPEIEDGIIPGRPVPPECHAEPHTDYDGAAVRWGLTHHTESAADCCQACIDQAKAAKQGEMKCNIWVYCPAEEGCFSPDIYEHKNLECWLKQADTPKTNFKGRYPEDYRRTHPSCPRVVPWVSGVIR